MKYYWADRNFVVEDGVARPPIYGEDIGAMTPFEESESWKKQEAQRECEWALSELQESDMAVLRWFESGVEPTGLKAYRDALRKYYHAIKAGEAAERPVLDDRSILKKTWDLLNRPIL